MRLKVLVVAGDEMLLAAYHAFLAGEGMETITARSRLDCLRALRSSAPDVLVLTPDLPWDSALGVLEQMLEEPDVPTIPVLILTAQPEQIAASAVPIPDYALLLEPVSPATVAGLIRTLADSGWCPPAPLLQRLGLRIQSPINPVHRPTEEKVV
jgi:DNA-binding response OmpR family regulator